MHRPHTATLSRSNQRNARSDILGDVGTAADGFVACSLSVGLNEFDNTSEENKPGNQIDQNVVRSNLLLARARHEPLRVCIHVLNTGPNEVLRGVLVKFMLAGSNTHTRIIFVKIHVEASLTTRGVRGKTLLTVREHQVDTVWLS
jgi:hypothetical protein